MPKHHFYCERKFYPLLQEVFEDLNFIQAEYEESSILIPKPIGLRKSIQEARETGRFKMIMAYPNNHKLVSKSHLWISLVQNLGFKMAFQLAPNTYILGVPRDIARLKREYRPSETYILKSNKQRRRGIQVLENLNQLDTIDKKEFVVAQRLIKNSLQIQGRRFNIRFYVIFRSHQNQNFYQIFSDGKLIYTQKEGNIEQQFISKNENYQEGLPRSYKALKQHLQDIGRDAASMHRKIFFLINAIFGKCAKGILTDLSPEIKFTELFGIDILLDEHLNPKILEVNQLPQMGFRDEAERQFKYKLLANFCSFYTCQQINYLPYPDEEMSF